MRKTFIAAAIAVNIAGQATGAYYWSDGDADPTSASAMAFKTYEILENSVKTYKELKAWYQEQAEAFAEENKGKGTDIPSMGSHTMIETDCQTTNLNEINIPKLALSPYSTDHISFYLDRTTETCDGPICTEEWGPDGKFDTRLRCDTELKNGSGLTCQVNTAMQDGVEVFESLLINAHMWRSDVFGYNLPNWLAGSDQTYHFTARQACEENQLRERPQDVGAPIEVQDYVTGEWGEDCEVRTADLQTGAQCSCRTRTYDRRRNLKDIWIALKPAFYRPDAESNQGELNSGPMYYRLTADINGNVKTIDEGCVNFQ